MELRVFQVDAFTDSVFGGNSAAVCPLAAWLPDALMQKIAMENAVAETVFFLAEDEGFQIRWFTPEIEMDLCGHATLAAAHVIFNHLDYPQDTVRFDSASGELTVTRDDNWLTLDFPARPAVTVQVPRIILDGLGGQPVEVLKARDYMLVYEHEDHIRDMQPDTELLNQINLDPGGIIVTAPGNDVDFVSRFFTPQASIFEDPVTGSAHCSLIPYWHMRTGKQTLTARQLSSRGGFLKCFADGNRVRISGQAVTYLSGTIAL